MYQPPDRRSKLSGSNAQALNVIRLRVLEGPNVRDQIAFYACHSFLDEVGLTDHLLLSPAYSQQS